MLVSILIPCFNAEQWIAQAIESALAQTWQDKEVVIRRFDGRIRWETGPNRGGGATRNRLLELARGEWLQYLDADDYLFPEKVSRQVEFLRQHPDVDVVYSPTLCEKIRDDLATLVDEPIPEPRDDPWVLLALWLLPQTGGPLWKRSALKRVNGWRAEQPCCQEHELYFRLLSAGTRFVFFDDSSAVYRNWDIGGRLTGKMIFEVQKQRLMILDRMERFLDETGALIPRRRQAINDARHQLARVIWKHDRKWADEVVLAIAISDPEFRPSRGPASRSLYRTAYGLVGFQATQRLADLARNLRKATRPAALR
jgi:glycosyltransferase involved in cell wall biosynthesis